MIFSTRSRITAAVTGAVVALSGCAASNEEPSTSAPTSQSDPLIDPAYCDAVRDFLDGGHTLDDLVGPEAQQKAQEIQEKLHRIVENAPEQLSEYWTAASNLADAVAAGEAPSVRDVQRAVGSAAETGRATAESCDVQLPEISLPSLL